MSKSHSGDAWMKLIGIGDHNVKRQKVKQAKATTENLNGYAVDYRVPLNFGG